MALPCSYRNQAFTLPTGWEDVTLGQVLALTGKNVTEAFEILTNIPSALLQEAQPGLFTDLIIPALSFLHEVPNVADIPVEPYITGSKKLFNLPVLYTVPDVEQETYGQSIDAMALLGEDFNLSSRLRLLAIYLQPAITNSEYDTDLLEEAEAEIKTFAYLPALALSDKFCKDIAEVCQGLHHQTEKIPETSEQRLAGISKVKELGTIITLDALANGDKTQYDYFLKQPWAAINNILITENRKAAYQYKLNKLLQPKKK